MQDALKDYSDAELLAASELYPSLWVLQHNIKTSNGLPYELDKHAFMRDILDDMSPLQVGLKPPQVGWSEAMIIKSFYVSDKKHKDLIYTLPTATDRDDMVGAKVNRIIAQNPILQRMVKDHDTVEQKAVGNNIIHYRGTFSQKQAMMVSSELNIHDEVDASDPAVITQYETRLMANTEDKQWRWYFSHPSLTGHGVDIYWQQSDKKEWFITCPSCGIEHFMTWPESIEGEKYVCAKCKSPISDEVRIKGKWKATAAGTFSGYHISQLMCTWIPARKIVEAKNDPTKDEQYFYNYVLGLPYMGGSDKVEPTEVLANCVDEVNPLTERIIIGVDTGLPIYFTMLNKDGVFYYNSCKDYTTLEGLLRKYPNSILVSDQGGDLIGIRQLQEKYPGRVFLCYYRKDRKSFDMIQWGEKSEYGKIVVDRNRFMSLIIEQIKDTGRLRLNGKKEDWKEWAAMFGNIYREVVVNNERPGKDSASLYGNEYVWKRSGPDHYVHTLLYALVGLDKYGTGGVSFAGENAFEGIPVAGMEYGQDEGWRANILDQI